MPRIRTAIWLTVMWVIAGIGGFNLCYGLDAGLPALAVLAVMLSLGALAGSLVPLVYGLRLWEEIWPVSTPAAAPPAFTSSGPSAAPAAASAPDAIVHEAGAPVAGEQTCVRCGRILAGGTGAGNGHRDAEPYPAGAWLFEHRGKLYHLDRRPLHPNEAFCSTPAAPSDGAAGSPPGAWAATGASRK